MDIEKHKILLVDDELEFLKIMKEFLGNEGYEVLAAENGEEAVKKLKNESQIAIVISDQKMGGMSGMELFEAVNNIDERIIKILVSGSIDEVELEKLSDMGGVFWYTLKPIDLMEVLNKIESGIKQYEKNISA